MILRTDKNDKKFEMIDKRTLTDTEVLQPEDLGILCFLLSNTNEWKFDADSLAKRTGWGLTKIRSSFKRLIANGYLYKKAIFAGYPKHFMGYAYILKESRFDGQNFNNFKLDESELYINPLDKPF